MRQEKRRRTQMPGSGGRRSRAVRSADSVGVNRRRRLLRHPRTSFRGTTLASVCNAMAAVPFTSSPGSPVLSFDSGCRSGGSGSRSLNRRAATLSLGVPAATKLLNGSTKGLSGSSSEVAETASRATASCIHSKARQSWTNRARSASDRMLNFSL